MAQGSTNAVLSPWAVVELDAFTPPEQTQASQWRRSWRAATHWIVGKEASSRQAMQESELRALPEVRLSHWVPPIDWTPAADALDARLSRLAEAPVALFITPPHSGHEPVVRRWAEARDVTVITPPDGDALKRGDTTWQRTFDHHEHWAIPALEFCFLRHTHGLASIRRFFEQALSGQLGRGVIGCDSWLYAYLQHTVGLEGVPVFTLQAVEGEPLAHYFASLSASGGQRPTVYSSRTGEPILAAGSVNPNRAHHELQRLAAHCRGHLGVAWHYWRERLREPSGGDEAELWLLDALAEAELPSDTGDAPALVLHALLIHGGLEDHLLSEVLPFSQHEALNARLSLAHQGIVVRQAHGWMVSPLSYSSVRQMLASRNYLVDPL